MERIRKKCPACGCFTNAPPDFTIDEVVLLRAEGLTWPQISQKLNVSKTTIHAHMKKRGTLATQNRQTNRPKPKKKKQDDLHGDRPDIRLLQTSGSAILCKGIGNEALETTTSLESNNT